MIELKELPKIPQRSGDRCSSGVALHHTSDIVLSVEAVTCVQDDLLVVSRRMTHTDDSEQQTENCLHVH